MRYAWIDDQKRAPVANGERTTCRDCGDVLAETMIYEMERRGEFPRRFNLTARCVVWDLAEVEAWLASRRSAPIGRAQAPDVRQRRSRPVREPDRAQAAASKAG